MRPLLARLSPRVIAAAARLQEQLRNASATGGGGNFTRSGGGGGTRPLGPAGAKPGILDNLANMIGEIANFFGTLVEMGSSMFVLLLKKAATGASPAGAATKDAMMGNIEYLQPYGWDPYGPGQSIDPYQMQRPETSTCHYLQQTWQRQCAARPETVGLMTQPSSSSSARPPPPRRAPRRPPPMARRRRPPPRRRPSAAAPPAADADARALYTSSLAALPPALRQWLDALPSSSAAQIAAAGGGASGGGGERAAAGRSRRRRRACRRRRARRSGWPAQATPRATRMASCRRTLR